MCLGTLNILPTLRMMSKKLVNVILDRHASVHDVVVGRVEVPRWKERRADRCINNQTNSVPFHHLACAASIAISCFMNTITAVQQFICLKTPA